MEVGEEDWVVPVVGVVVVGAVVDEGWFCRLAPAGEAEMLVVGNGAVVVREW